MIPRDKSTLNDLNTPLLFFIYSYTEKNQLSTIQTPINHQTFSVHKSCGLSAFLVCFSRWRRCWARALWFHQCTTIFWWSVFIHSCEKWIKPSFHINDSYTAVGFVCIHTLNQLNSQWSEYTGVVFSSTTSSSHHRWALWFSQHKTIIWWDFWGNKDNLSDCHKTL